MSGTKKSSKMDWLLRGKRSIDSYLKYVEVPIDERVQAAIQYIVSTFDTNNEELEAHNKLANRIADLVKEDEAEALYCAFRLGLKVGIDLKDSEIEKQLLIEKNQAAYRKQRPLEGRRFANRSLKGLVSDIARNIWKEDAGKQIRVGDMTKLILAVLPELKAINAQLARKLLVGESEHFFSSFENTQLTTPKTVRNWITATAPDYAKKPGAPRKSS